MRQAHVGMQDLAEVDAVPAPGGEDVQRERHVQVLGRSPERIVLAAAVRMIIGRRTPDQGSTESCLSNTLEFLYPGRDVLQGNRAQADEPLGIVADVFRSPIIKGAEGRPP